MNLVFKPAGHDFSDRLDVGHMRLLWQRIGPTYLAALQNVTGLSFREKRITVQCGKIEPSLSGISGKSAMRVGLYRLVDSVYSPIRMDGSEIIAVLTHELGHRLLAGHGIVVHNVAARRSYEVHRLLYLFLYATWVEAFGKAVAKEIQMHEDYSNSKGYSDFADAWHWAMKLTPKQRNSLMAYLTAHKQLPATN